VSLAVAPLEAPDEIAAETSDVVAWARNLSITTQEQHVAAIERLKVIKQLAKRATDFFKPMKQKADEAKKVILDREKEILNPLTAAEEIAKGVIVRYQQEQERIRRAEEARLQAEADERARKERERLEKQAAALKTPEKQAERLEMAAAVVAPVVTVAPTVERVAGVAMRKTWKAEVRDAAAFFKYCLENARYDLLLINEQALSAYAKSAKEMANTPGVRYFCEESLAVGGRS
jgi:hypothetical protein